MINNLYQTVNNISYIDYNTTGMAPVVEIDSTVLSTSLSNIEKNNLLISYIPLIITNK